MRQIFPIGLCCMALANPAAAQPATVTGSVLVWQEQEPGIAPYPNRMLITADHLRSDDGEDDGDYLLFDRRAGILYTVSHDRRTLLVMKADPLPDGRTRAAARCRRRPAGDARAAGGPPVS